MIQSLEITPIGFARTSKKLKFDAPHQPLPEEQNGLSHPFEDHIELISDQKIIRGVEDLDGFSHIWLLWWFHRNNTWKSKVLPPRGPAKRRGVFSTRSPHRPNFLGMTAVPLKKVSKNKVYIGNNDLVDGTPIFDIKPYLAPVDAISDATLGWTSELYRPLTHDEALNKYTITLSSLAEEQLEFLKGTFVIDFTERAYEILKTDPFPHRTRRIVKFGTDQFRMGCGAWRIFFTVTDRLVTILRIGTGFPESLLSREGYDRIPDRDAQVEFLRRWSAS